jgi:hypothetical protein
MQAASIVRIRMNDSKHVKMKIGDAEFEAEVPADKVQAMYDQFLAALQNRAPAKAPTVPSANGGSSDQVVGAAEATFDSSMMQRIFEQRADGFVTLKLLPKGDGKEADAFLLLLFGYRRLKGEEVVLGTHLLRAAELSGLSTYRPAHALASHERYVIRGGLKKGSTYALNNQGVTKAEEIAAKMFE